MHIQELSLLTGDLTAQAAFYREVLRLPIEQSDDALRVQVGRSRLHFSPKPGWAGVYHLAFDVPENQLEAACAWLDQRADLIALNGETRFHSEGWNADMVYFYDAAGNILEFIARHNQPNASALPFSEHSLLAITEIGLGTRDVRGTVNQLTEALGLRVYDGAGSSSFSAVGDEQGLFIVVDHERSWFPGTGVPGGLHLLTTRLAHPPAVIQVESGLLTVQQP
jgi:catechol-2,3-dioxygenase